MRKEKTEITFRGFLRYMKTPVPAMRAGGVFILLFILFLLIRQLDLSHSETGYFSYFDQIIYFGTIVAFWFSYELFNYGKISEVIKQKNQKFELTRSEMMNMNLFEFMDILYEYDEKISTSEMNEYIEKVTGNDINKLKYMLGDVNAIIEMRIDEYIKKNRQYIDILSQGIKKNGGTIRDQVENYIPKESLPEAEKRKVIDFAKLTYCIAVYEGTEVFSVSVSSTAPLDLFRDIVTEKIKEIENERRDAPPITWKGQNNVLTDAFREMKKRGYLTNSIPEIAVFLKTNFDCFKDTKHSTIETMLKNNNSSANSIPKEEKRIYIE